MTLAKAMNDLSNVHQMLYNTRMQLAGEMAHCLTHGNMTRADRIYESIQTVTQMYNLVASAQESLEAAQR